MTTTTTPLYVDLDSTFRERKRHPLPTDFTVDVQVPVDPAHAFPRDVVLDGAPVYTFTPIPKTSTGTATPGPVLPMGAPATDGVYKGATIYFDDTFYTFLITDYKGATRTLTLDGAYTQGGSYVITSPTDGRTRVHAPGLLGDLGAFRGMYLHDTTAHEYAQISGYDPDRCIIYLNAPFPSWQTLAAEPPHTYEIRARAAPLYRAPRRPVMIPGGLGPLTTSRMYLGAYTQTDNGRAGFLPFDTVNTPTFEIPVPGVAHSPILPTTSTGTGTGTGFATVARTPETEVVAPGMYALAKWDSGALTAHRIDAVVAVAAVDGVQAVALSLQPPLQPPPAGVGEGEGAGVYPQYVSELEVYESARENCVPLAAGRDSACGKGLRAFEVQLVVAAFPNVPDVYGKRLTEYPYLYLDFGNESANATEGIMVGNNPHARRALFKLVIADLYLPECTSFLKTLAPGMRQTVYLDPGAPLRLRVTLPSGEALQFTPDDTLPPAAPNPLLQVSATLSLTPV